MRKYQNIENKMYIFLTNQSKYANAYKYPSYNKIVL